jgi:Icc-related predicted phosphoesterase
MRLLAVADIHGGREQLAAVLSTADAEAADIILVAGDIVRFLDPRGFAQVGELLSSAGAVVLAVAGNCDGPQVEAELTRLGWNISGRGRQFGVVGVAGAAGAPPYHSYSWHSADSEIGLLAGLGMQAIAGSPVRILLAHTPPAGVRASTQHGGAAELPGSAALRHAMDVYQPDLLVCGHIHEGRSVTQVGRTRVVCCGSVRDGYYAAIALADREGSPAPALCVHLRQVTAPRAARPR